MDEEKFMGDSLLKSYREDNILHLTGLNWHSYHTKIENYDLFDNTIGSFDQFQLRWSWYNHDALGFHQSVPVHSTAHNAPLLAP